MNICLKRFPRALPGPPKSFKMRSRKRLGATLAPRPHFGPFLRHSGLQFERQGHPKRLPRGLPGPPKSFKRRSRKRFGATLAPGPHFAPFLRPSGLQFERQGPPTELHKAPEMESRRRQTSVKRAQIAVKIDMKSHMDF